VSLVISFCNKFSLLASPNLLEKTCLHEAVGERSRGRRWFCEMGDDAQFELEPAEVGL